MRNYYTTLGAFVNNLLSKQPKSIFNFASLIVAPQWSKINSSGRLLALSLPLIIISGTTLKFSSVISDGELNVSEGPFSSNTFITDSMSVFIDRTEGDLSALANYEQGDCYATLSFSLNLDCTREVTADMLLVDNALAILHPDYYKVSLTLGNGLIISDNILRGHHAGKDIMATVTYIGPGPNTMQGLPCMTQIQLYRAKQPFIDNTGSWTVYCSDPFLAIDPAGPDYDLKPTASQSCGGIVNGPHFAGDWVMTRDCELGSQDTAKVIFRQWYAESSDGVRISAMDTIYVLRLPPISPGNFFCSEKDTLYCGNSRVQIGPYLLLPDVHDNVISECDTIFFLKNDRTAAAIDAKCGLSVKVDSFPFAGDGCSKLTKYTVTVHQSCYGSPTDPLLGCVLAPGASDVQIEGGMGGPIYATCEFWLMELDTTPPDITCDLSAFANVELIGGIPTATIGSGNDCASVGNLPTAMVSEDCNEVKLVKVIVDDSLGVFRYELNPGTGLYEAQGEINLPFRPEPYLLVFEAYDGCHNLGTDTCQLIVMDETRPVATAHKGLHVEMNGKLTYLDASQIDNGSYDNCEVLLILGRRLDWQEGPLNLCDSARIDHMVVKNNMDSVFCAVLQPDAAQNELEAFYAQTIQEFHWMNNDCGDLMAAAWQYDLCKYATVTCEGLLGVAAFNTAYQSIYGSTNFDQISQIGGGWADKVPFHCADACTEVKVELLVMDYWCNWSTSWADILVEDKTIASVAAAAESEFSISCTAYNTDSAYSLAGYPDLQPLATIAVEAKLGNPEALTLLNQLFGGYQKAWDNGGQYVDRTGAVINAEVIFTDRGVCDCDTITIPITYFDVGTNMFVTADSTVMQCALKDSLVSIDNGVILVNCDDNAFCSQSVHLDLDDCSLGSITRTFKIWKTCGNEVPDTVEKVQTINLVNYCDLSREMFDLPGDTLLYTCAPEFDQNGSTNVVGAAHPDSIGRPSYQFADDCRIVGVAHEDLVKTNVNPQGKCYTIIRTWYFADWCINTEEPNWWLNADIVSDTFVQLIILSDTTAPECMIDVAGLVNDTLDGGTCPVDLLTLLHMSDSCGLLEYSFSLDSLVEMGVDENILMGGSDSIRGNQVAAIPINMFSLLPGQYRIRLRVVDQCENESLCIDTFRVLCTFSSIAAFVQNQILNQLNEAKEQKEDLTDPDNGSSISESDGKFSEDKSLGTTKDLSLEYAPSRVPGDMFVLYQNRPNPFLSQSIIGFHLPQAAKARLTIFDITGRIIKIFEADYQKGYHEIEVKFADLNRQGMLYYQLDTKDFSASRKMLVIE